MTTNTVYDLLCIGNYTKDTIITPAGTQYVDGGAVRYAAHAAAKLGVKTAVVTRLAEEDSRVVDMFKQSGIDCFPVFTPHSTLMKLEYPTRNPDLRTLSVAATAGSITHDQVDGLCAKAAVIGPSLRGEVGLEVIEVLKEKGMLVAADMQGYVRVLRGETLTYESWPEMDKFLSRVDVVKSDAVEAEALTGEEDIRKAAQFFADRGPREIVLTHKDGGSRAVLREMAEHAFRIGDEELARGTEVHLRCTAPAPEEELRRWVGRSFRYAEQVGETLGDRMRRAFEDLFAAGCARAVIIGTDVPELEPADVRSAFDRLEDADLVVGPSTDGGYYLLGIRRLHTELFEGIAWSSDSVCAETLRRAEAAGLRCALLDPLSDIDSMEDYLASACRPARPPAQARIPSVASMRALMVCLRFSA